MTEKYFYILVLPYIAINIIYQQPIGKVQVGDHSTFNRNRAWDNVEATTWPTKLRKINMAKWVPIH